MQKIKKMIILLSIILIIIITALIIILSNEDDKQQSQGNTTGEQSGTTGVATEENILQVVQNRKQFYAVKTSVEKYYLYYARTFNAKEYCMMVNPDNVGQETIAQFEQENAEILYNMIDEEYIQAKGITTENIKAKMGEIKISIVNITDIYSKKETDNITVYVVKGMLAEEETKNVNGFSVIVKMDTKNGTFSVIPQEYVEEKYTNLETAEEINVVIPENIQENKNNKYKYKSITDETYVKDLCNQLEDKMEYFTEQVYNSLDENYRNKVFGTYEEFKTYAENNKTQYSVISIDKYQKTVIDEQYTQYICIDAKGNYYIFKESAPFQYTLRLDNYTVPTEEFTEEYNRSSDAEKVVLNIKRFFMGIDNKNYGYSYSVLSDAFKNNKYPTKNDFINYAKQNFFEENEIEYISYEKENGLYIYKIKLTDATGKYTNEKEFNIFVKLNSGTDFEMSFGTN